MGSGFRRPPKRMGALAFGASDYKRLFLGQDATAPTFKGRPWLEWEMQAYSVSKLRPLGYTVHGDQNAGKRNPGKAKASGMLSGFPDLSVWLPSEKVILFEIKRTIGGTVSPVQSGLHKVLTGFGFLVYVIWAETPDECFQKIYDVVKDYKPS